jgi:uncharacterized protein (DUF362 family)
MKCKLSRREFIVKTTLGGVAFVYGFKNDLIGFTSNEGVTEHVAKIALHKTANRKLGVSTVMGLIDYPPMDNKNVIFKPNFNTSDPAPASTHNDTLSQIIVEIKNRNAKEITLAERSWQNFDEVIEEKGIDQMAEELGFEIRNLDNEDYTVFNKDGLNWENGFRVPNIIKEAEYLVTTCCLKTHFIGVITMSLKLSVGIIPTIHMKELHGSPHINSMIAEINLAYKPDLIIMDGVKTFIDGGPSRGTVADGNVMLAGTDRIALDAVGTAILIDLGSDKIKRGKIFELEQINRAVELGLGIDTPEKIQFVTSDDESAEYAFKIKNILLDG